MLYRRTRSRPPHLAARKASTPAVSWKLQPRPRMTSSRGRWPPMPPNQRGSPPARCHSRCRCVLGRKLRSHTCAWNSAYKRDHNAGPLALPCRAANTLASAPRVPRRRGRLRTAASTRSQPCCQRVGTSCPQPPVRHGWTAQRVSIYSASRRHVCRRVDRLPLSDCVAAWW